MSFIDPTLLIDDRPQEAVFRVHKNAFRSKEIFDLEMRAIFEGTWVFAGLAAEARRPHDFFTVDIGRHPVLVMRDVGGNLGAFINSCRHRGSRICPLGKGTKRRHTCAYHGWTYDSAGKLWNLKDKEAGAYPPAFDAEDHDLARVPRMEEYRGFIFVSFNPDVPTLTEHLGDARVMIDLLCDQSPVGEVELVPGRGFYTYNGNWKMQLENCTDGYHFLNTHNSFMKILARRAEIANHGVTKTIFGDNKPVWETEDTVGNFTLTNGNVGTWTPARAQPSIPLYAAKDEVEARVGPTKLKWMFDSRNVTFFPNMQIASNFSTQLRVMRPLAPDKTEMNTYCLAPVGESADSRRQRLRQYEDFFNPTGVATPDDNSVYEDCQVGNNSDLANWHQGYMRGMMVQGRGSSRAHEDFGLNPVNFTESKFLLQDETIFHGIYREWLRLMTRGVARTAP